MCNERTNYAGRRQTPLVERNMALRTPRPCIFGAYASIISVSTAARRKTTRFLPDDPRCAASITTLYVEGEFYSFQWWCGCHGSGDKRPSSLPVECPLIFEPPPITLHAAHLLTVVIRHGIIRTGTSGINSVLLDPLEESALLLHELNDLAPVQCAPDGVAEEGPDEPAEQGSSEGGNAHGDERVGGNGLGDDIGNSGRDGDGHAATGEGEEGGNDRGREGVAPA